MSLNRFPDLKPQLTDIIFVLENLGLLYDSNSYLWLTKTRIRNTESNKLRFEMSVDGDSMEWLAAKEES